MINLGTEEITKSEQKECEECSKAIKSKIARQEFVMNELLDEIEDGNRVSRWMIKDSRASEQYRRSMIQTYYLEQESQQFQRYIDKSDLSENLAESYKHDIHVYVSEELDLLRNDNKQRYDDTMIAKRGNNSLGRRQNRGRSNSTRSAITQEINDKGYFTLTNVSLLQTAD